MFRPDLVDMSKVSTQTSRSNLEHAFTVAEQLGVARLLDPEGKSYRHWCPLGSFYSASEKKSLVFHLYTNRHVQRYSRI